MDSFAPHFPTMPKPFEGLNFCCTGLGLVHRQELDAQIAALGGVLHVDLMSLVNFLVVGGRKTEKYKYSVRYRHDISFVGPEAVSDIHARWIRGDDDTAALDINQHLLPVFSNFTVCVARVDRPPELDVRRLFAERFRRPPAAAIPETMPHDTFLGQDLIQTMAKLGADVSATLTLDCSVLVGTDTEGKRYHMAQEWRVPVVHPMWVYDSCLRGAALHLEDYELTPGSFNLYSSTLFTWKNLFLSRLRPSATVAATAALDRRDRPLLKKTSDVWTSIMSSTHQPAATKHVRDSSWADGGDALSDTEADGKLIEITSRFNTFSPPSPPPQREPSRLFRGLRFLPVGLSVPEQNLLRKVVESHLGEVATAPDDSAVTHIVLLVRDGPQAHLMLLMLPSTTKRRINRKEVFVVTDWFIERSVYYNRVCEDAWCRPMDGIVPLLLRYKVCISGFTGVEFLHIEKLIGFLNLEFCEVFNSKRDLLIVNVNLFKKSLTANSPRLFEYPQKEILDCPIYKNGEDSRSVSTISAKNKINAAKKWNIPVVSIAYLWEMIEILGSQPNLQLPDIFDLSWCIFAPRSTPRPSSLMDFVTSMSNNVEDDAETQDKEEDRVILPSPRKSKDKHKYGRIAGGGESLTEKLMKTKEDAASEDEDREVDADISINDENLTQVGYGSADSNRGENELLRKLEDINDRLPKRRRTRG